MNACMRSWKGRKGCAIPKFTRPVFLIFHESPQKITMKRRENDAVQEKPLYTPVMKDFFRKLLTLLQKKDPIKKTLNSEVLKKFLIKLRQYSAYNKEPKNEH